MSGDTIGAGSRETGDRAGGVVGRETQTDGINETVIESPTAWPAPTTLRRPAHDGNYAR